MPKETKERFFNTLVIYIGMRLGSADKLCHAFVLDDNLDGDRLLYGGRRAARWPIGAIIKTKLTKSNRMDFNAFEVTDDYASEEAIREWAAEDAVDRRAKSNESARAKMSKEHRAVWLETLTPLRLQYRNSTGPQRRALRQLVVEYLDS